MGRTTNSKAGESVKGSILARTVNVRTTKSTKTVTANSKASNTAGSTSTKKAKALPQEDVTNVKSVGDRSQQNFPYDIRLGGFTSILNAVTNGTPKVKRVLMEECDFIMECRVCRNLFRSLPNFLAHKQSYCKKVFDSTWSIGLSSLIQTSDSTYNVQFEVDPELIITKSPYEKSNEVQAMAMSPSSSSSTSTRSHSEFYNEIENKVRMSKSSFNGINSIDDNSGQSNHKESIRLQIKPLVDGPAGSVIVQQRLVCDPSNCDTTSPCLNPVETVARDSAILGPDGRVMYTGTQKGIEDVVSKLASKIMTLGGTNSFTFTCDTCKTMFDSDEVLRHHKRNCGKTQSLNLNPRNCKLSESSTGGFSKSLKQTAHLTTHKHTEISSAKVKLASPLSQQKVNTSLNGRSNLKAHMPRSNRNLSLVSLSPVKKIKLKYSKVDSAGGVGQVKDNKLSDLFNCNNCSSSFSSKSDMSTHMSMCTGRINYAVISNREDCGTDKICITVRHDFSKPTCPVNVNQSMEEKKPTNVYKSPVIDTKVTNESQKRVTVNGLSTMSLNR